MTTLLSHLLSDAFTENPRQRRAWMEYSNVYEGDQLTPRQRAVLKELGLSQETANLVAPSINAITGNEIAERVPWRLNPNALQFTNELAAFGQVTSDAMVAGGAMSARSRAHKGQLVKGIGWVHVHVDDGPMAPLLRWEEMPCWDVFWDIRGAGTTLQADLGTARWCLYRKFYDVDKIMHMFGLTKDNPIIQRLKSAATDDFNDLLPSHIANHNHAPDSPSAVQASWFCDDSRRRPAVACVYTKTFHNRSVLYWPSGRKEIFSSTNSEHIMAMYDTSLGVVMKQKRVPVITRYYFAAGLLLAKDEMPELQGMYPLIPFVGMVKEDGEVYGMVKDAAGPQARYNNALQTIINGLDSIHVILGSTAADDGKTDAQIIEKTRRRGAVWRVGTTGESPIDNSLQFVRMEAERIAQAQNDMITARSEIEFITGVNAMFMGQAAASQRSGRMADQQTSATLRTKAEYTDKYLEASDQMFKLSMALVAENRGAERMKVRLRNMYGAEGAEVELNTSQENSVRNLLQHAQPSEALTGESGSLAQQRSLVMNMMDRIGANSPEIAAALAASVWDTTGTPEGSKIAKTIRQSVGLEPPKNTDEWEQWNKAQEAQQKQAQEAHQRELEKLQAETEKLRAEAERHRAEVESIQGRDDNEANRDERLRRRAIVDVREQLSRRRLPALTAGR